MAVNVLSQQHEQQQTYYAPWIVDLLQPNQHCGVQGNTILEATAAVREAVAYAETTNNALCILSIDFKAAFDNISHTYLFTTLKAYGFCEGFQQRIKSMYEGATSSVQINLQLPNDIYIRRTAPLTPRRCILYIYSTNIRTEYFKHAAHSPFFPLQNAVYFIMLPFLFLYYSHFKYRVY